MTIMQVKADFTRTMTENIDAGISRPLDFYYLDGVISFSRNGTKYDVTFADELNDQLSSDRLRTALSTTNGLVAALANYAVQRLRQLRQRCQPNAKMIVAAINKDHVASLQDMFRKLFNIEAIILTEDCSDPGLILSEFKRSKDLILIAINMMTEGVNIKSARVILDLTNKTTWLSCIQLWSRVIRKENIAQTGSSYVYTLGHPPKVEIAKNFEGAILHSIKLKGTGTLPPAVGTNVTPTGSFVPIHATATDMSSVFRGIEATPQELALAAEFRANNPDLADGMSDTQLGKIAATLKPDSLSKPLNINKLETYDEKRHRLKVTVTSLANSLARKAGREPRDVHKAWIKNGNPRHEDADNAQLQQKVDWLVDKLEKFGIPNPTDASAFSALV